MLLAFSIINGIKLRREEKRMRNLVEYCHFYQSYHDSRVAQGTNECGDVSGQSRK